MSPSGDEEGQLREHDEGEAVSLSKRDHVTRVGFGERKREEQRGPGGGGEGRPDEATASSSPRVRLET